MSLERPIELTPAVERPLERKLFESSFIPDGVILFADDSFVVFADNSYAEYN
jgi:hypothetical protein